MGRLVPNTLAFRAVGLRLGASKMELGRLQDVSKTRGGKIHDENR
jgi:hypothetical protein